MDIIGHIHIDGIGEVPLERGRFYANYSVDKLFSRDNSQVRDLRSEVGGFVWSCRWSSLFDEEIDRNYVCISGAPIFLAPEGTRFHINSLVLTGDIDELYVERAIIDNPFEMPLTVRRFRIDSDNEVNNIDQFLGISDLDGTFTLPNRP